MAYFRKRGNAWEYRIKYTDRGKQKEISKGGFRTKPEARTASILVEEKLIKGGIQNIKKGEMLFEDWVDIHDKMSTPHRRETSNDTTDNGQAKLLDKFSGNKLNQIKRTDYQLYINDLLVKEDYAKNTVVRIHGNMMAIMNSAVEYEELEKNTLKGVQITKEEKKKVVFLKKQEVKQLLNAIKDEIIFKRAMVTVLFRTGLRSGELLGLFWSDIDFEGATLTVDRQRTKKGLGPPKTPDSYRTIALDNKTIRILQEYKEWQEVNENEKSFYTKSDYVMVDATGKIFYQTKPQDLMISLLRIAKLPPRKSAHLLRHTHAVMQLEAGVDIKTVSERLGHKNIQTTANTYLHITDDHEKNSLKKFEDYLDF